MNRPGPSLRLGGVVVLASAGILAAPAPVRAEDATVEANRHFQLGVALFKERRFEGALVEFERAHALAPHPLTRLNLGLAYRELTRYDEAIEAFAAVLVDAQVTPELAARATRERDALLARIGTVAVTSVPEGATITLDGRGLGTTPLARAYAVPPGVHAIDARAPDGRTLGRSVTVAAGDAAVVELVFPTVLVEPPPELDRPVVEPAVAAPPAGPVAVHRRAVAVGAWTAVIANAATVAETGAPVVGAGVRLGRLALGVDAVLGAWAIVPTVRVRLVGARLGVDGIVAVPVVLKDGASTETFVAGAGGLGLSAQVLPALAIYAEGLVSVAADPHGVTFPISLGVRAWLD